MTDSKKRRKSMLDSLAAAGHPPLPSSTITTNRAIRSARDAVDAHRIWELDPDFVEDTRISDRLDHEDIADLRLSIESNGQAVPILVRRHPEMADRYLLVYGRRRLEAIRTSDKVSRVRALVANLDDEAALRSQISENTGRRDLTFIEKALFARELVTSGFGNQSQVAEVLAVSKSAISMMLSVVESVGYEVATAIGPALGVGRPRWEALAIAIEQSSSDRTEIAAIARQVRGDQQGDNGTSGEMPVLDRSLLAFEAVERALLKSPAPSKTRRRAGANIRHLTVGQRKVGSISRTAKSLQIKIDDREFADWLESDAERLIKELHDRWKTRAED